MTSGHKPETNSVDLACNDTNGVDVFVHEMVISSPSLSDLVRGMGSITFFAHLRPVSLTHRFSGVLMRWREGVNRFSGLDQVPPSIEAQETAEAVQVAYLTRT